MPRAQGSHNLPTAFPPLFFQLVLSWWSCRAGGGCAEVSAAVAVTTGWTWPPPQPGKAGSGTAVSSPVLC